MSEYEIQADSIASEKVCDHPSTEKAVEAVMKADWPDVEDDTAVVIAAHAIAEHGVGRPWNDFNAVDAFGIDHNDLIEYGRAAVAALRAASLIANPANLHGSQPEPAPPASAVREATKLLQSIVDAFDAGCVQLSSADIQFDDEHPPHPWHEEWLDHARRALSKGTADESTKTIG